MQIVCPTCTTRYEVSAFSIGADGRSVRCARCRAVWFASPTADSAVAAADGATVQAERHGDTPLETTLGAVSLDFSAAGRDEATDSDGHHPIDLDAGRPPLVVDEKPTTATSADGESAKIRSLAARRNRQQASRLPPKAASRHRMPLAIVALLGVIAALIQWRGEVVRRAPQMASLYALIGMPVNLRKLAFTDVGMTQETLDGVPTLTIQGTIVSTSPTPTPVPRLRFALRNAAGAELHSWTAPPPQPQLAPFESLSFQSRVASPSTDGRDIVVRFFNRRDAIVSLR